LKAEEKEWFASDDYKKWLEKHEKREDDDQIRHDPDPNGWALFNSVLDPK
jgi:hypothetical protein